MNTIISLLRQILSAIQNLSSLQFVSITNTTPITAQKTFTSGIKTDTISENTSGSGVTINNIVIKSTGITVPDTVTSSHIAINQTYADTRYSQLYGSYPTNPVSITGATALDFNTLFVTASLYNDFTIGSASASETISHIYNLPSHPCRIRIAANLTVTFKNRADTNTGYLLTGGGSDAVLIGNNFDYIFFENGVGSYILGTPRNF